MPSTSNPLDNSYAEWHEWLDGNLSGNLVDNNSIAGVVYSLVQEMAIHEAYMELCRTNQNSYLATSLFLRSSLFNYFEAQAVKIRRITEPNPHSTPTRNLDVYSLRRIVDDIAEQRGQDMITRKNICSHFGYPVTAAKTNREYNRELEQILTRGGGMSSAHLTDALSFHRTLDRICTKRGLISSKFINELEVRINERKNSSLKDVRDYVDKYIAHSASDGSRQQLSRDIRLNTDAIKSVIQGIVECFYLLEMFVKRAGYSSLIPFGWDSHLNNLSDDDKRSVRSKFSEVDQLCTAWRDNAYHLLNG